MDQLFFMCFGQLCHSLQMILTPSKNTCHIQCIQNNCHSHQFAKFPLNLECSHHCLTPNIQSKLYLLWSACVRFDAVSWRLFFFLTEWLAMEHAWILACSGPVGACCLSKGNPKLPHAFFITSSARNFHKTALRVQHVPIEKCSSGHSSLISSTQAAHVMCLFNTDVFHQIG